MGNKISISFNPSESPTLDDVEQIEKGTRGRGDPEGIYQHPTVISIIMYYMNKKTLLSQSGFIVIGN